MPSDERLDPRAARLIRWLAATASALAGLGLWGWWALFMGWSHSYASPAFQLREDGIRALGTALIVAAVVLVAWPARPKAGPG